MKRWTRFAPVAYIVFLMLPIYWLLNMSFKTTNEILGGFDLGPAAAFSIVYFLIILFLSWLFYTLMMQDEAK